MERNGRSVAYSPAPKSASRQDGPTAAMLTWTSCTSSLEAVSAARAISADAEMDAGGTEIGRLALACVVQLPRNCIYI